MPLKVINDRFYDEHSMDCAIELVQNGALFVRDPSRSTYARKEGSGRCVRIAYKRRGVEVRFAVYAHFFIDIHQTYLHLLNYDIFIF